MSRILKNSLHSGFALSSDVLSMDVLGFHCGSKGIDTVLAVHVVASEEVARECSKVDVVVGSLHNTLMLAESLQQ